LLFLSDCGEVVQVDVTFYLAAILWKDAYGNKVQTIYSKFCHFFVKRRTQIAFTLHS
jgi:hypothetical protein